MSVANTNEDFCLICLKTNVFFEWTEVIFEFSGPSYKECYYRFTRLQEQGEDDYTQMLCLDCGNGLRNTYLLVERALKSDLILKEMKADIVADDPLGCKKAQDMNFSLITNTEQSLKTNTENQELDQLLKDVIILSPESDEEELNSNSTAIQKSYSINPIQLEVALKSDLILKDKTTDVIADDLLGSVKVQDTSSPLVITNFEQFMKNQKQDNNLKDVITLSIQPDVGEITNNSTTTQESISINELDDHNNSTLNSHTEHQEEANLKEKQRPTFLCSYCSRIFHKRTHLQIHERTHDKNRQRTEVCPVCGLKFYSKMTLRTHMPIHDANRVPKYKCEFCVKAFFCRGGLNIHRRKHLGLMVKCKFCPLQFYRQRELERHMQRHDTSPLTADIVKATKVQAKYFMKCETCGQKVNRNFWESHMAEHLNRPLVKCGICDKNYFRRSSLLRHVKQFHKIPNEECKKHIIKLGEKFKPRLSRLMVEQQIMEVYTEK